MDPLPDIIKPLVAEKYIEVSALTMMVYDYLLTLGLEVELIWSSKWSIIKILYVLCRYPGVIDVPIRIVIDLTPGISRKGHLCSILTRVQDVVAVLVIGTAEYILVLRTLALWGQSRRVSMFLVVIFVPIVIASFVCLIVFLITLKFGPAPIDAFPGCWVTDFSPTLTVNIVMLLISETIILILTLWAWAKKYAGHTQGGMIWTLYRDGILYYIYIFCIAVANIVMMNLKPRLGYFFVLTLFVLFLLSARWRHLYHADASPSSLQRVMHSVFTTRIILHMRQANQKFNMTLERSVSELRFQHAGEARSFALWS